MCVHNESLEYLRLSIGSICNQTYSNIEFIIIDDASNETCKNYLEELCKPECIKLIHNAQNVGLTKSLNVGLLIAKGQYIARMDADDYSVPERIEKQVHFLETHPDIDYCGTGVISFGDEMKFMSPYHGLTNRQAQSFLFFSSTLCHPSVMIRKGILERSGLMYCEQFISCQDYDLWERLSVFGKLAVMKEVLLYYRIHGSQITRLDKETQDYYADEVRKRRISRLGISLSPKEFACHRLLIEGQNNAISPRDVKLWVKELCSANESTGLVDDLELRRELRDRLFLYHLRRGSFFIAANPPFFPCLLKYIFSRLVIKLKLARMRPIILAAIKDEP
jgi:glycosyltransferase involved in cell wall biosynthesis